MGGGGDGGRGGRPSLVLIPEPGQEVGRSKVAATRSHASSVPSSSSSSAASRRLEFLQRVQQANRGLSTADVSPLAAGLPRHHYDIGGGAGGTPTRENSAKPSQHYYNSNNNNNDSGLPNIQFLLHGKKVQRGATELELSAYKTTSASNVKQQHPNNNSGNNNNNNAGGGPASLHVYLPHQRVGHYKTSAKEVYRARHKPDVHAAFCLDPRHASSAYRAIRTPADVDLSHSNTVLGNNLAASTGPAYFYLGPPMSAPDQSKHAGGGILNRPKMYIPTGNPHTSTTAADTANSGELLHRGSRYTDNISLTGQQLTTPRLLQAEGQYDEGDLNTYRRYLDALGEFAEASIARGGAGGGGGGGAPIFMPDIYNRSGTSPPGSRRKHGGGGGGVGGVQARCGSRESSGAPPPVPPSSSMTGADLDLLQQCLHVHQSQASAESVPQPGAENVKLKHFTQYVRKDDGSNNSNNNNNNSSNNCSSNGIANKNGKMNYNSPYRNHRMGEKKAATTTGLLSPSKTGRYVFDSVNSYIHFNKIYPRLDVSVNPDANKNNTGGTTPGSRRRVPQVDGFSPHCTETVLLKMMFEMNRPAPSVRSAARYSDIAMHADLDEFVVVGSTTTSVSRSTSVASRKLHNSGSSNKINNNNNTYNNNLDHSFSSNSTSVRRVSNPRRSRSNLSSTIDVHKEVQERDEEEEGKGDKEEEEDDKETGDEGNTEKDAQWCIAEVDDDVKKDEADETRDVDNYDGKNDDVDHGNNDATNPEEEKGSAHMETVVLPTEGEESVEEGLEEVPDSSNLDDGASCNDDAKSDSYLHQMKDAEDIKEEDIDA